MRGAALVWLAACGGTAAKDTAPPTPTGETGEVLDPPSLALEEIDGMVLGRVLHAVLPVASSIEARCDGGDETHVVRGELARSHDLPIVGLLGQTAYTCTVSLTDEDGGVDETTLSFETDRVPDGIPVMDVTPGPAAGAYTLFNHFRDGIDAVDQRLLIIDHDGRVRWYFELGVDIAGDVDARWIGGDEVLWGGGYGGTPQIVSFTHEVRYNAPPSATGGSYHHHTEVTPEGTLLSLVKQTNTDAAGTEWSGYAIEERDRLTQLLAWTWTSQDAFDAGILPAAAEASDPYHGNWTWRDGSDVYVSMRDLSAIFKLDRDTGAVVWELGAGRDFAIVDQAGDPLADSEFFYTQHAPEFDGDRMLVYDNGTARSGGQGSRVVEYRLDEAARTITPLWEWTEPLWKEPIWGDADRVGDEGHVLVAIGHCEDCSWTNEDARSALVELEAEGAGVAWRVDFPDKLDGLYRAQRLGGCDVFGNATLCPALLESP